MARISLALAAATVAATTLTATLGFSAAQAQVPTYGAPAAPTYQPAPPMPMQAPPGSYPAQRPMPPPAPMGAPPMARAPMGAPPMAGAPMSPQPMAGAPMGGPQTAYGRPVVPTPSQPFSNLQLPNQGVGDGAYGGGGVVLEYLPDGTRRVVQQ